MRNEIHTIRALTATFVTIVFLTIAQVAQANVYTWVGPAGSVGSASTWNNPQHWQDPGMNFGIPGQADQVIIAPSSATYINLPANITISSLQIGSGSVASTVYLSSLNELHVKGAVTVYDGSRLYVPGGRTAGVQVGVMRIGGDLVLKAGSLIDADPLLGLTSVLLDDYTNGANSAYQHIIAPNYAFASNGSFASPFPLSWSSANSYGLVGENVQLDIVDYCPQDVRLEGDLMVLGRIRCLDRHVDLQTGNIWLGVSADILTSSTGDKFAYTSSTYVPPAGSLPNQNIYNAPVLNPDQALLSSANFSGTIRKEYTQSSSANPFTFNVGYPLPSSNRNQLEISFDLGTVNSGAFVAIRLVNIKHPMNGAQNDYLGKYWILQEYNITNFKIDITAHYHTGDVVGSHNNMSAGRWDYSPSAWDLGQPANVQRMELSVFDNTDLGDFTGGPATKLPVELTSFAAGIIGDAVSLKWTTATEIDNFGFDVERSADGQAWESIGFVPGAGNSSVPTSYRTTDRLTDVLRRTPVLHYRLRQVDRDGTYSYSPVVEVRTGSTSDTRLHAAYPNPFNPSTTLSFTLESRQPVSLSVMNALGENIRNYYSDDMLDAGHHTVQFTATNLPSGVYYVMLTTGGAVEHRKIILTK